MSPGKTFRFQDLMCGYGDTTVVRGVSGCVEPGRVLAVAGRNGVGKTTLLKALAGVLSISQGSVRWGEQDLSAVPLYRRLDLGIAYAPQENVVFGDLSVGDNLWLHLPDRKSGRYTEAFAQFPLLAQRLNQSAGALSGGERKLLSFARTLGLDARLSLIDEPTEGVAPENIARMATMVLSARGRGASFIIVEQNLEFIGAVADDVIVLDHGEIVEQGACADLGRERIESLMMI